MSKPKTFDVQLSPAVMARFVEHGDGPVLAEVELHFSVPPLEDWKLVGTTIRRGNTDAAFVNLPARAYGQGETRRYFDYLRAKRSPGSRPRYMTVDPDETNTVTILKLKILAAYNEGRTREHA